MSIQGNVNQIIGLTGAALALGKKAIRTKKTAAPTAPAKKKQSPEEKKQSPEEKKQSPEEKWLNSLEPDQRKIIDSLSPKARQYVLEQAGIEPMRRDLANARAKSAIQNKKDQRDGYTQFMRAVAGKEE